MHLVWLGHEEKYTGGQPVKCSPGIAEYVFLFAGVPQRNAQRHKGFWSLLEDVCTGQTLKEILCTEASFSPGQLSGCGEHG